MDSPRLHHSSFARSVGNMIDVWHSVIIRELSLALTLNPWQMKVMTMTIEEKVPGTRTNQ